MLTPVLPQLQEMTSTQKGAAKNSTIVLNTIKFIAESGLMFAHTRTINVFGFCEHCEAAASFVENVR